MTPDQQATWTILSSKKDARFFYAFDTMMDFIKTNGLLVRGNDQVIILHPNDRLTFETAEYRIQYVERFQKRELKIIDGIIWYNK